MIIIILILFIFLLIIFRQNKENFTIIKNFSHKDFKEFLRHMKETIDQEILNLDKLDQRDINIIIDKYIKSQSLNISNQDKYVKFSEYLINYNNTVYDLRDIYDNLQYLESIHNNGTDMQNTVVRRVVLYNNVHDYAQKYLVYLPSRDMDNFIVRTIPKELVFFLINNYNFSIRKFDLSREKFNKMIKTLNMYMPAPITFNTSQGMDNYQRVAKMPFYINSTY